MIRVTQHVPGFVDADPWKAEVRDEAEIEG